MSRPLFDGIRFWVDDNVPMRERWLEEITVTHSCAFKFVSQAPTDL